MRPTAPDDGDAYGGPLNDRTAPLPCELKPYGAAPFAGGNVHGAMSLRDWFAGTIVAGLLSREGPPDGMSAENWANAAAVASYCYADAMLKARNS